MSIMIRDLNNMFRQISGMPINSKGGKNILKQAGVDTSSKQYQAVMNRMSASVGAGVAYTNPQAIKNLMNSFDKDGNYISPSTGMTGLTVNDSNLSQKNRIINVSEKSREEMFELAKGSLLPITEIKMEKLLKGLMFILIFISKQRLVTDLLPVTLYASMRMRIDRLSQMQ